MSHIRVLEARLVDIREPRLVSFGNAVIMRSVRESGQLVDGPFPSLCGLVRKITVTITMVIEKNT